jgi:hypothetical protein
MPFLLVGLCLAWELVGPEGQPTGRVVEPEQHFERQAWSPGPVRSPAQELGRQAGDVLDFLRAHPEAEVEGMLAPMGLDRQRVEDTLAFLVRVAEEDRGQASQRLEDPAFLAGHLEYWAWTSDVQAAQERGIRLTPERIRLTKYLAWSVEGRDAPEGIYQHALYADPGGALRGLTRPQVIGGAYREGEHAGAAEPLVWLTEEGVYEALMQGTIEVRVPGRAPRLFNVHVSNGVAYVPTQKDPSLQERYWYFRQVDALRGVEGIALTPQVAVAGDVQDLGLGLLVGLTMDDGSLRMAVLADTGGAFEPNLFQLDWLAGTYATRGEFEAAVASIPARAPAGLLVLKAGVRVEAASSSGPSGG